MASLSLSGTNDLSALDAKARANLAQKLSKIHPSVLTRPLTIHDIYNVNEAALYIPHIPSDLQLDFFFRNYNDIARCNYRPHSAKPFDVNRAIWYYGVSKFHTLSNRIDVVRYNVIVMAFITIAESLGQNTSDLYDPGASAFIKAYMKAWLSKTCGEDDQSDQEALVHIWMNSGFDLCYFPDRARRDMMQAVWKLQRMVSELRTVRPEDFLVAVKENQVPRDIFEREGPMLVLHWAFAHMKKEQARKALNTPSEQGAPVSSSVDISSVRLDQSPASDLLVDIEWGVVEQVLPYEGRKSWITPEKSLSIVQSVEEDFLAGWMEKVTLGRDQIDGRG